MGAKFWVSFFLISVSYFSFAENPIDPVLLSNLTSGVEQKFEYELPIKENAPTKTYIEEQRKVIDLVKRRPKNNQYYMVDAKLDALKILCDSNVRLTRESLADFANYPDSAVLKVDLYEGVNIVHIFLKTLKYLTQKTKNEETNKLYEKLKKTKGALEALNVLIRGFEELATLDFLDCADTEFVGSYAKVVGEINSVLLKLEGNGFDKKHSLVRLLKNMQKALELIFIRYNTEKTLNIVRKNLENRVTTMTGASKIGGSLSIPVAANVSVDVEAVVSRTSYGGSSVAFFTASKSGKIQVGSTLNLVAAKLKGSVGVEKISSDIFFSLEQMMDDFSQNSSLHKEVHLAFLNDATKKRSNMQDAEKELLRIMAELEGMIKIFSGLPQIVNLNWVDITKSKSTDTSNESIGIAEIKASTPILLDLGISLKGETSKKTYTRFTSQLEIVSEDCLPKNGLDEKTFKDILGKKYDMSESLPDANLLLGHLRSYVGVLEELINPPNGASKGELEKKKHMYEGLLAPKSSGLFREGRNGVFQAALVTAVVLRSKEKDASRMSVYKNIYYELSKLLKLAGFSKNSKTAALKSTKSDVGLTADCKINRLSAKLSFPVPVAGDISVNMTRQSVKNSPFQDENGKYMITNFSLPLASVGIIGMGSTQKKLAKIFKKVKSLKKLKELKVDLKDFILVGEAFRLLTSENLKKTSSLIVMGTSINLGVNLSWTGTSQFEFTWRYIEPNTPDDKALPGEKLVERPNGMWSLISSSVSTSLDLLTAFGKIEKKIGTDSYYDFVSRYNSFRIGFDDVKSNVNTAYEVLKGNQYNQLVLLFRNTVRKDSKALKNSNALFELQGIYNRILSNLNSESEIDACNKVFKKFLDNCAALDKICREEAEALQDSNEDAEENEEKETVAGIDDEEEDTSDDGKEDDGSDEDEESDDEEEEAFDADDYDEHQNDGVLSSKAAAKMNEALKCLDTILEMNYKYNYSVHYKNAYKMN